MYSAWFVVTPGIGPSLLATVVGVASAALGVWLTGAKRRARVVVPFSAGVLLGVVAFGLLPELIAELGAAGSAVLFATGYLLLLVVNRFAYPVCPSCSHDHDHNGCSAALHGMALPLVAASALHSFLDGWSISTAESAVHLGIRLGVPLAISLHKISEGIALGGMVRAAVKSRPAALAWCAVAEGVTAIGGGVGLAMTPRLGTTWIVYPLAIAAGWLFYLGFHAIHEEWKRRGPVPAFMPALTGAAGAAALQQGVRALFR